MDTLNFVKTLTSDGEEYFEFIINEKPLPQYFYKVYENWKSFEAPADEYVLPEGLTGVFNLNNSLQEQKLLVKGFLRENITREELYRLFPATTCWSASRIEEEIKNINNNEVLLYCCTCRDRNCGGIGVTVTKDDGCFVWSFDEKHQMQFRFDQKMYRDVFASLLVPD
jgi:hypothetical protein